LDNISKYLKKNFLVSTGKTIIISLTTLVLLPLTIERLGLKLYGIISLTLLLSGVSSIVDLGLSKSIVLLSGEKKISENKVVTSALVINGIIIASLTIIFILIQFLDIDLLGENLNLSENEKFILINTGFLILILTMLNNLFRAILEASYLIHIVNLGFAIHTPLLYSVIFISSFFTQSAHFYIIIPLFLAVAMLLFNLFFVKKKTEVKLVTIKFIHVRYVFKNTLEFLKIGLINSLVNPIFRYFYVLMVADVGLYGIFDLSLKIAMLANSLIVSISMPMFAVFTKNINRKTEYMIRISYKIFGISMILYMGILLSFYFVGFDLMSFLNLNLSNSKLLYSITFILLISIGSVAVVEVFYRYLLGDRQLMKAFLLKLIIPISIVLFYLLLSDYELIFRFVYAYSGSLLLSAIFILLTFVVHSKNKLKQK
jgi:O-antigen/teichoic acid export membrane protein